MKKTIIVIASIWIIATCLSACGESSASEAAKQDVAPKVDVVFDAARFLVDENGNKRTMTEAEVKAVIGDPQSVDEWNYKEYDNLFPVRSLYYSDGTEVYEFFKDSLVRIQILRPIEYKDKGEIVAALGLKETPASTTEDTGYAYRVYDCGVHDLWCMGLQDSKVEMTYISYTGMFG